MATRSPFSERLFGKGSGPSLPSPSSSSDFRTCEKLMRPRSLRLSLVFLVLLLAGGCGSGENRCAVAGKVTLDGKPLEVGLISFLPSDGTQSPSAGGPVT